MRLCRAFSAVFLILLLPIVLMIYEPFRLEFLHQAHGQVHGFASRLALLPTILELMLRHRGSPLRKDIFFGHLRPKMWLAPLVTDWGWEQGIGYGSFASLKPSDDPYHVIAQVFSNAQFNRLVGDPHLKRRRYGLVAQNDVREFPAKLFPALLREGRSVIQLDSDDEDRRARRALMAREIDALASDPSRQYAIADAPRRCTDENSTDASSTNDGGSESSTSACASAFWRPEEHATAAAVAATVGYNLFLWMFEGCALSGEQLDAIAEYHAIMAPAIVGLGSPTEAEAARCDEIRRGVYATVAASEGGEAYLGKARADAGVTMPAEEHLMELLLVTLFAGYGGTGDLAGAALQHIRSSGDPAGQVELFRRDPEAYMLEAARLYTAVGGSSGYASAAFVNNNNNNDNNKNNDDDENDDNKNNKTNSNNNGGGGSSSSDSRGPPGLTLVHRNGRFAHTVREGDLVVAHTVGPNRDPLIFGRDVAGNMGAGPDDFAPGRLNADRLVTWNAELRDIRKCKNAHSCDDAPRGCPGAHLARRLATAVVGHFVAGIERELGLGGGGSGGGSSGDAPGEL